MTTALWVAQLFLALVFLYSGICKTVYGEQKLVAMGQTGVEGLAATFIKFIGVSEIIGALGLIVPAWLRIAPALTPAAAFCLGFIMLPAAVIHYKRREFRQVFFNGFVLLLCIWVGIGRL